MIADLWRLWYQFPVVIPMVGPKIIADPEGRYLRFIGRWAGAGFLPPGADLYVRRLSEPGHAVAGSRWYRTSLTGEMLRWVRGEYADVRRAASGTRPRSTPRIFTRAMTRRRPSPVASESTEQFGLLRGELLVGENAPLM